MLRGLQHSCNSIHRAAHQCRTSVPLSHVLFARSVCLTVDPSSTLVDEKFRIKVYGLRKDQKITVDASVEENRMRFASYGHFMCGADGSVDLARDESLNGTYTGIHQMGLIWSLVQEPGQKHHLRLSKKDVTTAQVVTIRVRSGHVGWEDILSQQRTILASSTIERWYLSDNVTRTSIREGKLRGTLFIPKGSGPYPAVIDIFGGAGGLVEFRGSLLASRGFIVLCLPYFLFDDLVQSYDDFDFSYMEVKAVVNINSAPFASSYDIRRGKDVVAKGVPHNLTAADIFRPIVLNDKYSYTDKDIIKIVNSDAKFLLLIGDDDKSIDPASHRLFYDCLPEDKKQNVELVTYPGAGHLIEPPYSPLCAESTIPPRKGNRMVWLQRGVGREATGTFSSARRQLAQNTGPLQEKSHPNIVH